jgi:hypothetical protein
MKTLLGPIIKKRTLRTLSVAIVLFSATAALHLALQRDAFAADTTCAGLACEEAVLCASSFVIKCSDWNSGTLDGWSKNASEGLKPNIGFRGTPAWQATINKGDHSTLFFDTPVSGVGYGPLHARFYVKFSPGYLFMQSCGLQKMFYLDASITPYWRIMLGIAPAYNMKGSYATLPQTVGVFGFDYIGHYIRYPDQPGDKAVLIYPDKWYAVEIMAHWTSRTQNVVKIWVNGQLQMTRSNHDDDVWTPAHTFTDVQDASYYGGNDPACVPWQTQYVYKDNHILSKSYIGPGVLGSDQTPPTAPKGLRIVS